MVNYIFSDKTGTLTKNIMEFKKFSAGFRSYGETASADEKVKREASALDQITNFNF